MEHIVRAFPVDTLEPGDVIITNDPWITISQLHDIVTATPVFHKDRCVGLLANCCHALDIGGRGLLADARLMYEEGLFLPMMKLHEADRLVRPICQMIEANVRTPEEVIGDIHAWIIANQVGGRQLVSFLEKFGMDGIGDV